MSLQIALLALKLVDRPFLIVDRGLNCLKALLNISFRKSGLFLLPFLVQLLVHFLAFGLEVVFYLFLQAFQLGGLVQLQIGKLLLNSLGLLIMGALEFVAQVGLGSL